MRLYGTETALSGVSVVVEEQRQPLLQQPQAALQHEAAVDYGMLDETVRKSSLEYDRKMMKEFDPLQATNDPPTQPLLSKRPSKTNTLIALDSASSATAASSSEDEGGECSNVVVSERELAQRDNSKRAAYDLQLQHLSAEKRALEQHVARLRQIYRAFQDTFALCTAIYGDLRVATLEFDGCTKSGFLKKRSRLTERWNERYFILRDNFLFYFKRSLRDQASHGVIRLDDCLARTYVAKGGAHVLCIEVSSVHKPARVLQVSAPSHHVIQEWKTAVMAAAGWWTSTTMGSGAVRKLG